MWLDARWCCIGVALACASLPARARGGSGPVVVIDPGHGGANEGARAPDGTQEKQLTLDIARRVRAALLARLPGAEVLLTRNADVPLSLGQRGAFAEAVGAEVFVSIHLNAAPNPQARGVETYFLAAEPCREVLDRYRDDELVARRGDTVAAIVGDLERSAAAVASAALAAAVQRAAVAASGAVSRGVRQADYGVLMGLRMPAIVVEGGFLSNAVEGARLLDASYRQRLAEGIAQGIARFLAGSRTTAPLHAGPHDAR